MPHFSESIEIRSEAPSVLAAPIASRDIRKRWETSLQQLKGATERGL